jgi:uncharacterized protein (DUF58 family)
MTFSVRVSEGAAVGLAVVAILILVFFTSLPIYAQVSGATLSGTITDPQGAVVAGAKVTVRATGTGVVTNDETNSAGFYSVPNLNPADYEISVGAAGFKTSVTHVTLRVGDKQVLNLALTIGSVQQDVEVTSVARKLTWKARPSAEILRARKFENCP